MTLRFLDYNTQTVRVYVTAFNVLVGNLIFRTFLERLE